MDRTLRNVIIVCICIITFSISYYFVIYLPREKEKDRAEAARKEQAIRDEKHDKEMSFLSCKMSASREYVSNWESECKGRHLPPDCKLPSFNAKRCDDILKDAKEECRRVYLGNP